MLRRRTALALRRSPLRLARVIGDHRGHGGYREFRNPGGPGTWNGSPQLAPSGQVSGSASQSQGRNGYPPVSPSGQLISRSMSRSGDRPGWRGAGQAGPDPGVPRARGLVMSAGDMAARWPGGRSVGLWASPVELSACDHVPRLPGAPEVSRMLGQGRQLFRPPARAADSRLAGQLGGWAKDAGRGLADLADWAEGQVVALLILAGGQAWSVACCQAKPGYCCGACADGVRRPTARLSRPLGCCGIQANPAVGGLGRRGLSRSLKEPYESAVSSAVA